MKFNVLNLTQEIQINTCERRNEELKEILLKIDGVAHVNDYFDYELSIYYGNCFDVDTLIQIIRKEVGLYYEIIKPKPVPKLRKIQWR